MRPRTFALALSLAAARLASAQSPGHAIQQALSVLADGMGGCFTIPPAAKFTNSAFPGVAFYAADCTMEHGDPWRAVVALDADSVLYLLGERHGYELLIDRHPPVVDSASAVTYAAFALELQGVGWPGAHLANVVADLPQRLQADAPLYLRRCDGAANFAHRRDPRHFEVCGVRVDPMGWVWEWRADLDQRGAVRLEYETDLDRHPHDR